MSEDNKYTIKIDSKTITEHIMKLQQLRKTLYKDCNYLVISKIMYTRWLAELQFERVGEIDVKAKAYNYKEYIDDPSDFMGMKVIVLDDEDDTVRIG